MAPKNKGKSKSKAAKATSLFSVGALLNNNNLSSKAGTAGSKVAKGKKATSAVGNKRKAADDTPLTSASQAKKSNAVEKDTTSTTDTTLNHNNGKPTSSVHIPKEGAPVSNETGVEAGVDAGTDDGDGPNTTDQPTAQQEDLDEDEEEEEEEEEDFHTYACLLCGSSILKLDNLLAAHPQRRTDGCLIVKPHRVVRGSLVPVHRDAFATSEEDNTQHTQQKANSSDSNGSLRNLRDCVVLVERYNVSSEQIESSVQTAGSSTVRLPKGSKGHDAIRAVEPRVRYQCAHCGAMILYQVLGSNVEASGLAVAQQRRKLTLPTFDNTKYPFTEDESSVIYHSPALKDVSGFDIRSDTTAAAHNAMLLANGFLYVYEGGIRRLT